MRLASLFLKAVLSGIGTAIGLKIGKELYRLTRKQLEPLLQRPQLAAPPSQPVASDPDRLDPRTAPN